MEQRSSPRKTHHAILIGVNAYKTGALRGAAQDVQSIRGHIEKESDNVHITMLTATEISNPWLESRENSETWPTFRNVRRALEGVINSAAAGDFVYIHFSGHGTSLPPDSSSYNPTGDLALVLLGESVDRPEIYLDGRTLASYLKLMVDKGLVVTLVLDCCFSASIFRQDEASVRCLTFDLETYKRSLLDGQEEYVEKMHLSTFRDASMRPNWMLNPDGHAIVVACGHNQIASELDFKNNQFHGALSFMLLQILKSEGLTKIHSHIFDRIRAEFKKHGLRQEPVLYGNKSQGFFGVPLPDDLADTLPVISYARRTHEVQVGLAHGFEVGDEFSLHALGSTFSMDQTVTAKIVQITMFASFLELPPKAINEGALRWRARILRQAALCRPLVRLAPELPHHAVLDEELQRRSLQLINPATKQSFIFQVSSDKNGGYGVQDSSGQTIINTPAGTRDQPDSKHLGQMLEHLVKYQAVKDLRNENSSPAFRESFTAYVTQDGGRNRSPQDMLIQAKHCGRAEIIVENQGPRDLYVFLYNLGPSWQIQNVYRGTYVVVAGKSPDRISTGPMKKTLRMKVPESMLASGHTSCEDILKVIVTTHPTSFDLLELPRLGEMMRVKPGTYNRRDGSGGDEDWVAMNFHIRTSV